MNNIPTKDSSSAEPSVNMQTGIELAQQTTAPVARKAPHEMEIHQHKRVDDYYWMRDDERKDSEILDHLRAENSYADTLLAPQKELQDQLFAELKARIVKDDSSIPAREGKYWYFSQINGDQEFARFYRSDNSAADNPLLLLDANLRAQDQPFYDLGEIAISPNDQMLSFAEDLESRRIYTIYFKHIDSDTLLEDMLEGTEGDLVWANDNQHVFYVKKDLQTLLGTQVFRHKLGTAQAQDVLVYEQQDLSFYMSLGKSRDDSRLFIHLEATESSDTLFLDAATALGTFESLIPYQERHEYQVDKLGDYYYIVSNWQAQNFRLLRACEAQISDRSQWQELRAHDENVLLESVELFNDYYVLSLREQGQLNFRVEYLADQSLGYALCFDDPCYLAALDDNPDPDSDSLRIYYSSLTTPASWYQFDLATGERKLLKQQRVEGEFDSKDYRCERQFVDARDGQKIPISLVYRRSLFKKDGTNPVLQYGYGAYGITIDPSFSSGTLSLLDRGFVFVIAHIRGSEMLGRDWYEQGKKAFKQNTFNDFIDVSQYLVREQYADPKKLCASGGSAGGLLMGAVLNQAPQLYLAVGAHVPFVDVVTTMLDESLPLTTNEYDEWGNPNRAADYQQMLAYSPYDNVAQQSYPHLLVTTGLHDSQVQYFEPMKWVAKLRDYKTDNNLLVFKTDMDAGHGGAAGRFKSLHEKALEMAFFIKCCQH